ncbi:MAG: hypothetical protein L6R28_09965 [Planctomycetes bacterium]|nr:hypothetical protein [Planctomycetota bacterium]
MNTPPPQIKTGEAKASEPMLSDGWVSFTVFALFVLACVLVWWLAQRNAIPGAPGAPLG